MLIVSLVGCLLPLDTDFDSERFPAISGVITNSEGQRLIRVAEISNLSLEARAIQSSGQLFENGAPIAALEIMEPGQLRIPESVQIMAGKTYHIEIVTEEGETFQTQPQTVLAHNPEGYQLSFDKEIRVNAFNEGQEEDGLPRTANLPYWVDILIDITSDSGAAYFRWEVAETWLFRESPKPRLDTLTYFDSTFIVGVGWIYDTTIEVEFDPIKLCYLSKEVEENPSFVASTSGLNQENTSIRVFTRPVDQSFIDAHYFRIYTHRIEKATYEFYEKNQQLIAFQGQLYDEIPAGVDGNVFDVANPTRRVLGYVEFSIADTTRISVSKDDLGIELLDDCRPNPGDPVFCERLDLDPCKCWDCDSLYGKDKLIRPVWFN